MKVNFTDNFCVEAIHMDRSFDVMNNQIMLNIAAEDVDIDELARLVKENGNSFDFTIGSEEANGYSLTNASENYDVTSDIKNAYINFVKQTA